MPRRGFTAAFVATLIAFPSLASAGVYTDDLSRCLVKATTPEDQNAFIKWMFMAMALHPMVSKYATISDAQRAEANEAAGKLMNKMLLESCREATVQAVKYEGLAALQAGFQVFGQVAGMGLMSHQDVAVALQGLGQHVDETRMKALMKEAGQPVK